MHLVHQYRVILLSSKGKHKLSNAFGSMSRPLCPKGQASSISIWSGPGQLGTRKINLFQSFQVTLIMNKDWIVLKKYFLSSHIISGKWKITG